MEDGVTQRVREFLESIHLTVNGLSRVINIGQPTLSKQMKEGGCGVSLTTIVLLLEAYPDLSAEWLLRGEGGMKKGEEWKVMQFIPVQNNELVDAPAIVTSTTTWRRNLSRCWSDYLERF
jgi:hypothetical protein